MQKKINLDNNGFMLVEVIVVSVIVVVIMTSLYIAFNRVYGFYDKKENYTSVDAIYGIKTIEDYMIDNDKFNSVLNSMRTDTDDYKEVVCTSSDFFVIPDGSSEDSYCTKIFTQYNIYKMYLVKLSNSKTLPDLSDLTINQTFKEYISYLNNAVTFNSSFVFLVETYEIETTNEDDKKLLNKYAYLEVE